MLFKNQLLQNVGQLDKTVLQPGSATFDRYEQDGMGGN